MNPMLQPVRKDETVIVTTKAGKFKVVIAGEGLNRQTIIHELRTNGGWGLTLLAMANTISYFFGGDNVLAVEFSTLNLKDPNDD